MQNFFIKYHEEELVLPLHEFLKANLDDDNLLSIEDISKICNLQIGEKVVFKFSSLTDATIERVEQKPKVFEIFADLFVDMIFDDVEIHPLKNVSEDPGQTEFVIIDDEKDAELFGVFIHLVTGGIESAGDFSSKDDAIKFQVALMAAGKNMIRDEEPTAFGFNVQDVMEQAETDGQEITEKDAIEILGLMNRKGDVSIGISWDTITYFTEIYLEDKKSKGSKS